MSSEVEDSNQFRHSLSEFPEQNAEMDLEDRLRHSMGVFPKQPILRLLTRQDRAHSDPNLARSSFQGLSSLSVSKQEITLGCGDSLIVFWDIKEEVCATDWIGLYSSDEMNPSNFIDFKNRGVTGTRKGQMVWDLEKNTNFRKAVNKVCYKYYHGNSGQLRAVSPTVTVYNHDGRNDSLDSTSDDLEADDHLYTIIVSKIYAENLKKGMFFNPDPYVKLMVKPIRKKSTRLQHHEQQYRTQTAQNTVMPSWENLTFDLQARISDMIEFEVKDKFVKSRPIISRFLGKVTVPVETILQRVAENEHSMQLHLNKHHPSDPITGTLSFTIHLEDQDMDGILPNGFNLSRASSTKSVCRSHSVPQLMLPVFDSSGKVKKKSAPQSHGNQENEPQNHSSDTSNIIEEPITPDTSNNDLSHEDLSHAAAGVLSKRLADVQSIACESSLETTGNTTNSANETISPNAGDLPQTSDSGSNTGNQAGSVLESDISNHLVSNSTGKTDLSKGSVYTEHPTHEPPMIDDTSSMPIVGISDDSEEIKASNEGQIGVPATNKVETMSATILTCQGQQQEDQDRDYGVNITENQQNMDTTEDRQPNSEDGEHTKELRHRTESDIQLQMGIQEEIKKLRMRSWSNPSDGGSTPSPSTAAAPPQKEPSPRTNQNDGTDESNQSSTSTHQMESVTLQKVSDNPLSQTNSVEQTGETSAQPVYNGAQGAEIDTSIIPEESEGTEPSSSTNEQVAQTEEHNDTSAKQDLHRRQAKRQPSKDSIWHRRQNQTARPKLTVNIKTAKEVRNESDTPTPLPTPQKFTYRRYESSGEEEPLPGNWEARIDQYNRVFYIDHVNRTTTWSKPTLNKESRKQQESTDSHQSRQQLERRYQSFRRTLQDRTERRAAISVVEESRIPPPPPAQQQTDSGRSDEQTPAVASSNSVLKAPAVQFIIQRNFFEHLRANMQAFKMYQKNSSLKHMVNKIRRDPNKFGDYQHNRDLVALLNLFSERGELPSGWEKKKDKSGKQFFINHTRRTTTFIDPRLPVDQSAEGANLLPLPTGFRERSRSEGEDDVRRNADMMNVNSLHQPVGVGPPVQPRPIETLGSPSLQYAFEQKPLAYNEKLVAFLRQPNINDILKERQSAFSSSPKLRDKLNIIRQEGIEALNRLENDIEVTLLLSLFDDEIQSYTPIQAVPIATQSVLASHPDQRSRSPIGSPVVQRSNVRAPTPYRRDFDAKLRSFYKKLENKGYGQGPTKLKITIRREHLLEDAFGKISAITHKDIRKCKLFICFAGEEGLDYGGPSREFFFLLSRQLFNPYYGLFEYSANDTYTVQISPMSAFVDNHMEWFRFCGRVIGLSIIHHYLLDAFFTRPFYKALLRQQCTLSDLESLDSGFHQSLLWMKDNDITGALDDLTFTADEEVFGQVVERELKTNGKNIPVTEKNKKEYIERIVKWRIERGVSEQTETLVRGFYEVVDSKLISVFDAHELELVIAGTAEIDTVDWRKNTEYRGGYQDHHHVIGWFWAAVEYFDNERRLRLLQFVTGTSSIPYEGFAALRGSNGPRKFCIEKWGKSTSLPRAHTCFNRLDLPSYTSYAMLLEKLVIAVEETSTFGID